jgi:DNA-nicking Smr family endonuclease
MDLRQSSNGIIELDIHGMTKYQAKTYIDSRLNKTDAGIYRIRIIHGYHGGIELKSMVFQEYRNHKKVKRIEVGLNPGITELVLREF